jgi:hypothetical protein
LQNPLPGTSAVLSRYRIRLPNFRIIALHPLQNPFAELLSICRDPYTPHILAGFDNFHGSLNIISIGVRHFGLVISH